MKPHGLQAIISSTARDLPEHRKAVNEACQRMGIFPLDMANLPARDADAIRVSLELVDQADIYIGIFAHRYGHIPAGHDISITEMEFNRALERKIPILIFLIHKEHSITIEMVESGDATRKKLEGLKERAAKGRIRREFRSPDELRGEVIAALAAHERENTAGPAIPNFHPPNIIPQPPEPYIAHPYSLLQTKNVIGRQEELNLLTDWVTKNEKVPADVRLFNIVAIGGMGKSALTWKWFNDIAPNERKWSGRMWWSFYESDAYFENFIIRALAYVSGQPEKNVRDIKSGDREDQLLHILASKPFLLVLDGLERILLAYARMDAAQMLDDDEFDRRTANQVVRAVGLPQSAADSFVGRHQLRLTTDHRAGQFLRRLTRIRESRILISTRLYPTELQAETGNPLHGCAARFLPGLSDNDALNLWREFKVTGSTEELQPLFRSFGNYPLLIRALAGEVANFRGSPGDFDKWKMANPDFDPINLPLANAKTHVLQYALQGLDETQCKVLHTIAAFRMPATWDTLRALLVNSRSSRGNEAQNVSANSNKNPDPSNLKNAAPNSPSPLEGEGRGEGSSQDDTSTSQKPCPTDLGLDQILRELEDRGLVGWDKKSNRYDLHPIVRGVVWQALDNHSRRTIYTDLHDYFDAVPRPRYSKLESLEELTPTIELYQSLIGLKHYRDAFLLFSDHLNRATHFRFSASRQRADLLERLFPDGIDNPPRLESAANQSFALNALAQAYLFRGEPGRAVPLYRRAVEIDEHECDPTNAAISLANLSEALRAFGALRADDSASRRAIQSSRLHQHRYAEGMGEYQRGFNLAICGVRLESGIALRRSKKIWISENHQQGEGFINALLAEHLLLFADPKGALFLAQRAWKLAGVSRTEVDFIRAARLHGTAALGLNDLDTAYDRLQHGLTRARAVNRVEEELPALALLAELHRRKLDFTTARDFLDQIWEPAERGPYPLFHADALNVLAQIEIDEQRPNWREAAIAAATKAYTLAWCDGISEDGKTCYAYHYGLTNAKKLLAQLGAPEPKLPPFDESKFEPLPKIELNPKDDFWVDPATLDDFPQ